MTVIGIDPGLDGGIAWLSESSGIVRVELWPMPTIGTKRRELCMPSLIDKLSPEAGQVFIERQQPIGTFKTKDRNGKVREVKPGAVTSFQIGHNYGLICGVLWALELPYTTITARSWQAVMHAGLDKRLSTKERSIIAAQRLYPHVSLLASEKCRKPHDGMADALLIAEYGRRTLNKGAW